MKLKNIILITVILMTVLTISSVSAADNNATNEVMELENTDSIDNLTAEPGNDDILEQPVSGEDDSNLKAPISNDSSQSTSLSAICVNESNVISVAASDSPDNAVLKSAKKVYTITSIKFKHSNYYPLSKTLKTGDTVYSIYKTNPKGQFGRGLSLQILNDGLSGNPLHTKVKKVKFYYKNKETGKYKVKTVTKIKNDNICILVKSSLIKGYKPIKAKIWYTSR